MGLAILAVFLSYGLGSCSCAILICKLLGAGDPRAQGSLNPGATNVMRIAGKKAAFFTLLGDLLKGFIPVLIVKEGLEWSPDLQGMVGVAAFLGHLYPIFFKFKGGKGVATWLGVLFGFSAGLGLVWAFVWGLTAFFFRYSSLAALVATVLTVLLSYGLATDYWIFITLMGLLIVFRHRENIQRLIQGKESKIGKTSTTDH